MSILLLRHATAGKSTSAPDDHLRPLDERGLEQAERLVETLASYDVQRILTSPYVRCRQTVEPLARALGLPIEERDELAEGSTAEDANRLAAELNRETAVLCTHGDVVYELLGEESKKGSTWVLEAAPDGGLARLEYLPPPAEGRRAGRPDAG
jgi:phosphohistidine phosphatase SixA